MTDRSSYECDRDQHRDCAKDTCDCGCHTTQAWTYERGWVDLPDPGNPYAGFLGDEAVRAR